MLRRNWGWWILAGASLSCAPPITDYERHRLCDDKVDVPCLSGRACAEDEGRGCEVCRCTSPPFVPYDRYGPPGHIEVKADPTSSSIAEAGHPPSTTTK